MIPWFVFSTRRERSFGSTWTLRGDAQRLRQLPAKQRETKVARDVLRKSTAKWTGQGDWKASRCESNFATEGSTWLNGHPDGHRPLVSVACREQAVRCIAGRELRKPRGLNRTPPPQVGPPPSSSLQTWQFLFPSPSRKRLMMHTMGRSFIGLFLKTRHSCFLSNMITSRKIRVPPRTCAPQHSPHQTARPKR